MATAIIIAILAVIVFFAVRSSRKHFAGEGGCCGGCDSIEVKKKKLDGPAVQKKIMHIEGMHCDRCRKVVENAINGIDGAVGRVNLRKQEAEVTLDRDVPDEVLARAVRQEDYKVTGIETVPVKD